MDKLTDMERLNAAVCSQSLRETAADQSHERRSGPPIFRRNELPKPNRKTVEAFYDVFADMDPQEQEVAMRVLEQTHRLSKRAKTTARTESQPEQVVLPGTDE